LDEITPGTSQRDKSSGEWTRRKTVLAFLFFGWFFVMVIFVGSDLYSFGRFPTLKDFFGYCLLATALSPIGAVAIGLKGGWIQDYIGLGRVLAVLIGIVLLGVVAAIIVNRTSG